MFKYIIKKMIQTKPVVVLYSFTYTFLLSNIEMPDKSLVPDTCEIQVTANTTKTDSTKIFFCEQ